jgi:competence protein ComEC
MDLLRAFLFVLVIGVFVGVFLASVTQLSVSFAALCVLLSFALLTLYAGGRVGGGSLLAALACAAIALGVIRFDALSAETANPHLERHLGETITATGTVTDEVQQQPRYQRLTVKLQAVGSTTISERLLVRADQYPTVRYGDTVVISGTLEKPENFETDTGREFNYRMYLAKDGIHYVLAHATARVTSHGNANPIIGSLLSVKRQFLEQLRQVLPEPQVSLMGGLLVGATESFSDELEAAFRETGIIHIVVLSGYNVTLVADAIMRALAFLPLAASMTFGALGIVLFAVMTGASATVVRASIMALIVLFARAFGERYDMTRALFLAGLIMVLHNPYIVAFSPSFQLSFMATLGLIWVSPLIERTFHFVPTHFGIREFATATASTQLFVLPLLLYQTGTLSLVALPTNMLVLAFIPVTMLTGFLTGLVTFVSPVIAMPLALVTHILLTLEIYVVQLMSSLPFASVTVPPFAAWWLIVLYGLFGVWLVAVRAKPFTAWTQTRTLHRHF